MCKHALQLDPHTTEWRELSKHPAMILDGVRPHSGFRHAGSRISITTGNIAWLLRRHRFNIACGAVFLIGVALAVGCAGPGDAGYAPVVKALVSSAVRG